MGERGLGLIAPQLKSPETARNRVPLFVQYEPTGFTIYFQFISIINLYMFRGKLLLIIRRYYSVYT
jgi:hypothetical protein